jgi:cation transport regulator ChaB
MPKQLTVTVEHERRRFESDPDHLNRLLAIGARDYHDCRRRDADARRRRDAHRAIWAAVRAMYGFAQVFAWLLSEPSSNDKLKKSAAWGLTLQHHLVTFIDGTRRNMCKWAGVCTKMCVLDNGNGAYPATQRARIAKTHLWVKERKTFVYLLGFEIARAIWNNDGKMLLRPNVNSDEQWQHTLPALVDGSVFGTELTLYGYSKDPSILDGDGWVTPFYRVAFSANEHMVATDPKVQAFLARGGSVAVVTNRTKKRGIEQWHPTAEVVNADPDDRWMFTPGVIGDLSAKGKARKHIGRTDFIASVY